MGRINKSNLQWLKRKYAYILQIRSLSPTLAHLWPMWQKQVVPSSSTARMTSRSRVWLATIIVHTERSETKRATLCRDYDVTWSFRPKPCLVRGLSWVLSKQDGLTGRFHSLGCPQLPSTHQAQGNKTSKEFHTWRHCICDISKPPSHLSYSPIPSPSYIHDFLFYNYYCCVIWPAESIQCCSYTHVFRADHLALDNQLRVRGSCPCRKQILLDQWPYSDTVSLVGNSNAGL